MLEDSKGESGSEYMIPQQVVAKGKIMYMYVQ